MKRFIGSIAAALLALSLGVSAYAKVTPVRNSKANTSASAPKVTKHKNKKRTRTSHHKKHKRSAKMKTKAPEKAK